MVESEQTHEHESAEAAAGRDPWDELDALPAEEEPHPWSFTVMTRNLLQTADSALLLAPGGRVPAEVLEVAPEDTVVPTGEPDAESLKGVLSAHGSPFDALVVRHLELTPQQCERMLWDGGLLLLELRQSAEESAGGDPLDLVHVQRELVQAGFTVERADTHRTGGAEESLRVVVIARTPRASDEGRTNMRSLAWDPAPEVPEV